VVRFLNDGKCFTVDDEPAIITETARITDFIKI
jgi:hypothetical protein